MSLLLATSFHLNRPQWADSTGAQNLEATYHVLLTVAALEESPASSHWFLPTVTFGRSADKHIPWGGTVPTRTGDYIYTSFTPPGFLVPYLWFKVTGVEPSVESLAHFNFGLGSVTAMILFAMLDRLLRFNGYGPWTSAGGALAGTVIGIFSREALQSHGIVYWSQSLYQLILVVSIYQFLLYLTSETPGSRRWSAVAMIVAAFLGPMTEWTGYIFNAGLVLALWFNRQLAPHSRVVAMRVIAATVAALILTVVHFGMVVGYGPTFAALTGRFISRSATGNLVGLLQGYALSYGLFLLVIGSCLGLAFFARNRAVARESRPAMLSLIAVACMPLLENLLMLQHATQFSFDRLKFVVPASIFLASYFASGNILGRFVMSALLVMSCFHGFQSYRADRDNYATWAAVDAANRKLAMQIARTVDINRCVFSSNIAVRAYANLLFHRGIYEYAASPPGADLVARRGASGSVHLVGTWAFLNLQKYTGAVITLADGTQHVLSIDSESEPTVGHNFYITDDNWVQGVSRHWAGFYVPNSPRFSLQYRIGRVVGLPNGEQREVVRTQPSGPYLHVYLDGKPLDPDKVGCPNTFVASGPESPSRATR